MGHYTTIARFARMAARSRGQARPAHQGGRLESASNEPRPVDDAPYRCPSCGDGSVVPAECGRCDVVMYRRDATIELPARPAAASRRSGTLVGVAAVLVVALMLAGLVATLGVPATRVHPWLNVDGLMFGVWFLLMAMLFATIVAGANNGGQPRWAGSLRSWLDVRSRRRRMASVEEHAVRVLPAASTAPVRVRGRVRIEGENAPRFEVVDGDARVRVLVGPELSVFDADGERRTLEDGAEVELVGVGRRALGGGESYRDARGELVFEKAEIFVSG